MNVNEMARKDPAAVAALALEQKSPRPPAEELEAVKARVRAATEAGEAVSFGDALVYDQAVKAGWIKPDEPLTPRELMEIGFAREELKRRDTTTAAMKEFEDLAFEAREVRRKMPWFDFKARLAAHEKTSELRGRFEKAKATLYADVVNKMGTSPESAAFRRVVDEHLGTLKKCFDHPFEGPDRG